MLVNIIYNLFIMPLELVFEVIFSMVNRIVNNPAISIIALSLAMNFLVLPLYKRADAMQEQERDKINSMAYWVNHIKKTFKGDEKYMMLTTYYRQQNYKPIYALRSSFSLILQIPFFIAAYHYLSNLPLLNGAAFLFLRNLGAPDQLLTIGSLTINIMPIIMTLINFASAFIYLKGFPIKDKVQTYGIGIIFLILLYNSPSGLVLYWTLNQIFSMLKNVFMKLVKNKKVLNITFSMVGFLFLIAMIALGECISIKRTFVVIILTLVCQLPTIISLVKSKKKQSTKEFVPIKYRTFLLGLVLLTLLMGVLIPLSVISASPQEFLTEAFTPATIVIKNASIVAGYFLVWFNVFYYLANPKGRNIFTYIVWAISGVAILDYMFFGTNLGTLSTYLLFDKQIEYSTGELFINAILVCIVAAGFCILMKFARKIIPYLYLIFIVGIIAISVIDITKTTNALKNVSREERKDNQFEPIIHLSKEGQNIVVFMLDRAISGYVPYIMQEKPELIEKFDGFTYYPNTLSFGLCTNIASPALFGGYDYTPLAINERVDETLVDKHNEALKKMPIMFANEGYSVTAIDLPYANYDTENFDVSIFDGIQNVKAYRAAGKYFSNKLIEEFSPNISKLQERNMFFYSVLKMVPLLFQETIYDDGEYWSTAEKFLISESFLQKYAVLDSLSSLTDFNCENNSFLLMDNDTTHEPVLLKTPEYVPTAEPIKDIEQKEYVVDGKKMKMETELQVAHYQCNMAAFIKLGEWFDYLRENGAYDNTRIIIVADHGRLLDQQFDYMNNDIVDVQGYNPLFLVKDFNSVSFTTDNSFMTNADVLTFATNNIIECDNTNKKGDKQIITTSGNWQTYMNNGNTFDTSDGQWLSVHDNIFDINNWEVVGQ